MLVSLANNNALGANASATFPYACRSVSKVFIKVDDSTGTTAYDHTVKISLGQRVICQSSGFGLLGASLSQGGTGQIGAYTAYSIDLGSHELLNNENLYVTISAGSNALDAVDVSALVNEDLPPYPVRWTEYSDNTFTNSGNIYAIGFASGRSDIDEDATTVEIRDRVNSSAPSVISGSNWFHTTTKGEGQVSAFAILKQSNVPLTTSFNYASGGTMNRILCASLLGSSRDAVNQASQDMRQAKASAQVSQ